MCDRPAELYAREVEREVAKLVDHHTHGRIVITSPIFSGPLSIKRLNRAALAGIFSPRVI
jgi:hypothetical protein